MKTFLITLAITAVLLASVVIGKQFLLNRLVAGFDGLTMPQKQTRLLQIASFGTDAIDPLAARLLDEQDPVSESAFGVLRQMQNDWITMPPKSCVAAHEKLVAAISRHYRNDDATARQIARARELLRQTVTEFASPTLPEGQSASAVSSLLAAAHDTLNKLDGKVTADSNPNKISPAGRLPDEAASMATRSMQADAGWTDWPPPMSAQIIRSGARPIAVTTTEIAEVAAGGSSIRYPRKLHSLPNGVTASLQRPPVSLRTTSTNMQTDASSPIELQRAPANVIVTARQPIGGTIEMTTHLTESPMTAMDDETVIRHLAHPDAMMARQAEMELRDRGFQNDQLQMATAIAVASPPDRIRLIDELIHDSRLRSGPWLAMMLDDPDRRVRLHIATTLAPMLANNGDAEMLKRVRHRLAREDDVHVATRLRKILDLR